MDRPPPFTLSVTAKRGVMYGLAVGMLAGLIYEATVGAEPGQSIVVWRNFILAGGWVGVVIGWAVGRWAARSDAETRKDL